MKKRFRAPSPAFVVALLALFVALGGTSYAAVTLAKNSVGTAQLKNGAVTAGKINGSAHVAPVIYARVLADGTIDPKGSKGVTGSMVTRRGTSVYCFSNLPFAPKSGVATIDYAASDNGNTELAQIDVHHTGTALNCADGERVAVATSLGSGTYSPEPFYIVLYG